MTTERSYDPASRVRMIRERNDRGEIVSGEAYVYDASGRRTHTIDERHHLTQYAYDGAGRLVETLYPMDVGKIAQDYETRITMGMYPEYRDRDGGREDERAPAEFGFAFNGHGILDREDVSEALSLLLEASGEVYKHRRGHKPDGRGRWWVEPGEGATEFARPVALAGDELDSVEAATAALWGRSRNVDSRRWSWVEEFTYDENGNRSSVANGWGRIDYAYDDENRLMSAGERSYSYDANGNMIGEALGDLEVAYAYNASNRVVDVNTEVEGLVGRHWWRGSSWSLKSGVRYEYDALGRRVSRTEYETTSWGGHWQRSWDKETNSEYLYDGQSMRELAEFRDTEYENDLAAPWTPWNWGGSRPRWGHHWGHRGRRSWWNRRPERYQPVSEYVYGNNDRVISRNSFNPDFQHPRWESATYYHQDVLGSTTLMTNQRGHTVERYTYDAFGVQTEGSFDRVNEIGYTGQRYDPTTSMYDYGFRDYAPELARFTTVDPVRDGNNWYAYVNNDPVNFVDPLGLIADEPGDGTVRDPYADARRMEQISNLAGNGEVVYADRGGIVFRSGYQDPGDPGVGMGWRTSVDTEDGYYDQYGHLDPASTLSDPTRVFAGDPIGRMADPTNGYSTGPHVHRERRAWNRPGPDNTIHPSYNSPFGGPSRITSDYEMQESGLRDYPHRGVDHVPRYDENPQGLKLDGSGRVRGM